MMGVRRLCAQVLGDSERGRKGIEREYVRVTKREKRERVRKRKREGPLSSLSR